jgi:hypothetical protein
MQTLAEQRERHNKQDNLEVAATLNQIGWVCDKLADFEQALESYKQSLNMYQRVLKDSNVEQCAFVVQNLHFI